MLSKRYPIGQLLLVLGIAILAFSAPYDKPWAAPVSAEAEATPVSAEVEVAPAAVVPGGPGYVMIPAVAFLPASSSTSYTIFWGDLSVPESAGSVAQSFYAPVFLPQGARLTGITLFYHDTINDSKTLGVDLLRKPLPGLNSGESVGLSVYSNQTDFGQYQSDTTPNPDRALVDNSQYSYWLSAYIFPAPTYLQLQAVRVDYTFSSALPLIIR